MPDQSNRHEVSALSGKPLMRVEEADGTVHVTAGNHNRVSKCVRIHLVGGGQVDSADADH